MDMGEKIWGCSETNERTGRAYRVAWMETISRQPITLGPLIVFWFVGVLPVIKRPKIYFNCINFN